MTDPTADQAAHDLRERLALYRLAKLGAYHLRERLDDQEEVYWGGTGKVKPQPAQTQLPTRTVR